MIYKMNRDHKGWIGHLAYLKRQRVDIQDSNEIHKFHSQYDDYLEDVKEDLNIDLSKILPSEDYIKHIYEDEGQYLLAKKLKPNWIVHDPDGIWSSLGFYILLEPKK